MSDAAPAAATHTVRHFLAALAYRFHKAVAGAPDGFGAFAAGHGVRTPQEIVHHVNGVLGYAEVIAATGEPIDWYEVPHLDWEEQVALLHEVMAELDAALAAGGTSPEQLHRLLQGPLADAMTHVGQLAMLRRIAGSPIPAENFYMADVEVGRVGSDQPEPVSPD